MAARVVLDVRAATLVAFLVLAADARAAVRVDGPTPLRPVGSASADTLRSDGRRWVLWIDGDELRAYDDARNRTFVVPGGIGCPAAESGEEGPTVELTRDGIGLVACGGEHRRFQHGRAYPIPGLLPGEEMRRIGRRWAEGSDDSGQFTVLVNWRTGERREPVDECYDLDRAEPAELDGSVCFYRTSRQREGRYRLVAETRYWKPDRVDLRAGGRLVARLNEDDCEHAACSAQLASSWVTLAGRHDRASVRVLAYDIDRRRTFRWRVTGLPRRVDHIERVRVAHTRRSVFVAAATRVVRGPATSGSAHVARTRVLRGRLP